MILTGILFIAVIFLFYKQFSTPKIETTPVVTADYDKSIEPIQPAVALASLPKGMPIVFINSDSLLAHYELAKKARAANEVKIASYQKTYQVKVDAFQKQYNDYMEKAGAGAYTKEQGLAIEEDLKRKQEEIVQLQQHQEKLAGELDNTSLEVQKKIYDFMNRFNKQHGYYCAFSYTRTGGGVLGVSDSLDVTSRVIAGLNAEYRADK